MQRKHILPILITVCGLPLAAQAQISDGNKPHLLGLITEKTHSLAVVELGKEKAFLKTGDRIAEYTLKSFKKKSIILSLNNVDYELAIGEGEMNRSYENSAAAYDNPNPGYEMQAPSNDMQPPDEDYAPDIRDEPTVENGSR